MEKTREEIIAMRQAKDEMNHALASQAITDALQNKEDMEVAVLALRAAGATVDKVADALGISPSTAQKILRREDSQKVMALVREVSKVEAVTNGLLLQRRYMDALRRLPLDRDHANAHRQLAAAFATIFDKAALAAGEATERTESKVLAITLDERRLLRDQLRDSQELRIARESISERASDSTESSEYSVEPRE